MTDTTERESTPLIERVNVIEDVDEAIEYSTRSSATFQWIVFVAGTAAPFAYLGNKSVSVVRRRSVMSKQRRVS